MHLPLSHLPGIKANYLSVTCLTSLKNIKLYKHSFILQKHLNPNNSFLEAGSHVVQANLELNYDVNDDLELLILLLLLPKCYDHWLVSPCPAKVNTAGRSDFTTPSWKQ